MLLLAVGWFFTLRPTFLGGPASYITLSGTSMEPTMSSGDLVVVREQDSYAVGDIVAFRVPEGEAGAGLVVVHRIAERSPDSGYVTQGDNGDWPDRWRPTDDDVIGKSWFHVPNAGQMLGVFREPLALGIVSGLIVTVLIARGGSRSEGR